MTQAVVLDEQACAKDHALWKEEIKKWRREHARALETLEEVAKFIHLHEAELEEHLRDIQVHEKMKESGAGASEGLKAHHLEVKGRQQGFRGRHRGMIDKILELQVMLHKASHGSVFG